MEYYQPWRERSIHTTTWMSLENMITGARHKRPNIAWFHLQEMSRISKSIETKKRNAWQGLGLGGGKNGEHLLMSMEFLLHGGKNDLEFDSGDGRTSWWLYQQPLNCSLKAVNWRVRELYFSFKIRASGAPYFTYLLRNYLGVGQQSVRKLQMEPPSPWLCDGWKLSAHSSSGFRVLTHWLTPAVVQELKGLGPEPSNSLNPLNEVRSRTRVHRK